MKTDRSLKMKKVKKSSRFKFEIHGSVILEPKQIIAEVECGDRDASTVDLDEVYREVELYDTISEWLDEWNMEFSSDDSPEGFYIQVTELKDES